MNAHPKTAALAAQGKSDTPVPATAANLVQAARYLLPYFEAGHAVDAKTLRCAMQDAFGASDTSGAWIWKDAYNAAEVAQVMVVTRYGAVMQRQAESPIEFLRMIERLTALAPPHTRRSEDSVRLQQFSTPLPPAAIVAQAAGFCSTDQVLEPSAGTGLLAVFAKISRAGIALNELDDTRRDLLRVLIRDVPISDHDAAAIDDRLDRAITPSVIVMNPPFSAAQHVAGKYRQATSRHGLSALARLAPGGRLVVITSERFNATTNSLHSTFKSIGQSAAVVFSAAIAGNVFARHGTTVDTRLTVIDKSARGDTVARGLNEDGVPILRVKRLRPMATEIFTLSDFSKSQWEEVADSIFEDIWQTEVEAVSVYSTTKITLICGLLLPIWDRLRADNMRIHRLQAIDSERAIGRLVTQDQLRNVYARLGLDCELQMDPKEVRDAVMHARATLGLITGLQLRRSVVMGQPRLELTGVIGSALQEMKSIGYFTEVIQWKTRLFLSVDAPDVLAALLQSNPVGTATAEASR